MPDSPDAVIKIPRSAHDAIAEALTRAFHDDPSIAWMFPDPEKRTRTNRWFFHAMLEQAARKGVAHTTADSAGGAIWVPPAAPKTNLIDMIRIGFWKIPFQAGFSTLPRFLSAMSQVEKLHKEDAPKKHWYLAVLGVDTGRQGQGIGGDLIQPVLARADSDNLTCYLETAKEINVTFYNKHGFEVLKEVRLGKDGPPMWTMLRQPMR